MCFSNKETINKLMSIKKSCITKHLEKKNKSQLGIIFGLASKACKQYIDYYPKQKSKKWNSYIIYIVTIYVYMVIK